MITIKRENSSVDNNTTYEIYINNLKLDSINNNEIKKYDLKDGDYEIYIKNNSFISNKIKFNLYDDQIVTFTCNPLYNNNNKIFYKLIKSSKGIKLKMEQNLYL